MDAFEIAQGSQRPSLAYPFTIDGAPVDLSGGQASFAMRAFDGTAIVAQGTATIPTPTSGTVVYAWGTADTATVGDYRGRIVVTFASGGALESPEFPVRVYAYAPDRSVPGAAVELGPLIRRVRRLLDDSPGPTQEVDDAEIAEVLDRRCSPVYDLGVTAVPQRRNGTVVWQDYYVDGAFAGGTAFAVRDAGGHDIAGTAYAFNPNSGLIRFAASTGGSVIFVTGTVYQIGDAAADCLQGLVTRMARAYDVQMDGQTFNRSQVYKALRERIADLRGADSSEADVNVVHIGRTDMAGSGAPGRPADAYLFDQQNPDGRKVWDPAQHRYVPQPPGGSYEA